MGLDIGERDRETGLFYDYRKSIELGFKEKLTEKKEELKEAAKTEKPLEKVATKAKNEEIA